MNPAERRHRFRASPPAQQGAALLITLALVGIVGGMAIVWVAQSSASEARRVQDTAKAMGMIRDALVARAASDFNRPGSLPCPDYNNDGSADGSLCTAPYVGRVPWKTLDLPDLRDATGERFWYALSPTFRDHPNACTPTPCVLNSDTPADLTINGVASQENVAIIFAPGEPLGSQDRDPSVPTNLTNPANYLEGNNVPTGPSDKDYQTGGAAATFNDRALVITRNMLMPAIEQRVARQARQCLEKFAASGGGRYPFAAPLSDVTTFNDVPTPLYGRIPMVLDDTDSILGTAGWPPDDMQDPGRAGTEDCFRVGAPPTDPSWWDSWRELLLYRVSVAYAPGESGDCSIDPCLTVNSNGTVKFVVIVAGRTLASPDQSLRASIKFNPAYYLEAAPNPPTYNNSNFSGGGFLGKRPLAVVSGPLGGFNDRLECASESGAAPCD
jgi:hypothetical protein